MKITRKMGLVLALIASLALAPVAIAQAKHGSDHGKGKGKDRRALTLRTSAANPLTVASFADGVLVLKRGERTYSGRVDSHTKITCHVATTPRSHGKGHPTGPTGPTGAAGPKHKRCGTDALTAGAEVKKAKLKARGDRGVWREVELKAPKA